MRVPPLRERLEDIPVILRHCLDQTETGRWVEIGADAARYLQALDFSWPGNVRHLEQLAARLSIEGQRRPIAVADLERLLGAGVARAAAEAAGPVPGGVPVGERAPAGKGARPDATLGLEAGLPLLLAEAERSWLEAALRRHPGVTRAELAAKLKISESALYKKLRLYGLGG